MSDIIIKGPTRAIVCFGPATETMGMRAGQFYQVTIDPQYASPGGDFIRFDMRKEPIPDEIHGWQRIDALTVCEVLFQERPLPDTTVPPIAMRAVVKE